MKTSTIVTILIVLLAVLAGWYWLGLPPMQGLRPAPPGVACTMEAMQCPDGSYVGRTGPNCEFVCPSASTTSAGSSTPGSATTPPPATGGGGSFAEYHSGIRGTVMAGPMCPVERTPPDPACADKPVETNVSIYRSSDLEHAMAITQSNKQGTFQVSLPPGNYTIMSGPYGVPYPRCTDATAVVGLSAYTPVTIQCDTGIR